MEQSKWKKRMETMMGLHREEDDDDASSLNPGGLEDVFARAQHPEARKGLFDSIPEREISDVIFPWLSQKDLYSLAVTCIKLFSMAYKTEGFWEKLGSNMIDQYYSLHPTEMKARGPLMKEAQMTKPMSAICHMIRDVIVKPYSSEAIVPIFQEIDRKWSIALFHYIFPPIFHAVIANEGGYDVFVHNAFDEERSLSEVYYKKTKQFSFNHLERITSIAGLDAAIGRQIRCNMGRAHQFLVSLQGHLKTRTMRIWADSQTPSWLLVLTCDRMVIVELNRTEKVYHRKLFPGNRWG
eukprot:TRINITY_DN111_c0_g2_i6.p1 TRINITY_DN111_c0_g2~~TRINITY_DN111_c0_g2_i6.p1  ORF type:complete len:295 (+),score=66.85 TRINITY_DN111_c0_g2_i6:28-912(+)